MKAEFLTELDVRRVDDGHWTLLAPLGYASAVLDRVVEVPAGYTTDFASVPRVPIVFELFGGICQEEAVIHDFLYSKAGGIPDNGRAQADAVFLEAMGVQGKPDRVRYPMYWGVRLGGWRFFHKKGP